MNSEINVVFNCKEHFWHTKILSTCSGAIKFNTIQIFLRSLVKGGEGIVTVENFINLLEVFMKRGYIFVASSDKVSGNIAADCPVINVAGVERIPFLKFIKEVAI